MFVFMPISALSLPFETQVQRAKDIEEVFQDKFIVKEKRDITHRLSDHSGPKAQNHSKYFR